jgi:large subunit ribosomal protein L25
MREVISIAAEARARAGKGTARATRLKQRVPAVIYGGKQEPVMISLDLKELLKEYTKGGFTNRLVDITLDGAKHRVLPRDLQVHPVTDRPIHVDFMRVSPESRVRIFVPVHFTESELSPGIKKGGVLNVVRHEIEFYCSPDSIPEGITISLAGQEIATSIHISQVKLPDGVRPVIGNRDFTVATIAAPSKEDAALAAASAATAATTAAAAAAAAPAGAKAAAGKAPAAGAKAPAAGAKAPAAAKPAAKK